MFRHRTGLSSLSAIVFASVVVLTLSVVMAPSAAGRQSTLTPSEATASRGIAHTVWFQGHLASAETGEPINATYNIVVSIYNAEFAGLLLWGPETHNGVNVIEGWFNIELGATVPLLAFDDPPYYLELTIDAETLEPRQKLGSVPSALHSGSVESWVPDGDDVYHLVGRVGIGTSSPSEELDVDGTVRTTEFTMPTGASDGHVLTSDAFGAASWQAPTVGDITSVVADDGLAGGGDTGDINLSVGAGDGISVSADSVAVDASALAGDGLGVTRANDIYVNAGTGLEIAADTVRMTAAYSSGSAHDARFVNEDQANSVTTAMVDTDFISSLDGVSNDGGDIDLIEGANVTITPDDTTNAITIAVAGTLGDITGVYAEAGLSGSADSGNAFLSVGAGDGIYVSSNHVHVDVPEFAGAGLVDDGSNNLDVNVGIGLEVVSDTVRIAPGGVSYGRLADPLDLGTDTWSWGIGTMAPPDRIQVGYPALHITNVETSDGRGDCLWLTSSGGSVDPATTVLFSETNEGSAGLFQKSTPDTAYALRVVAASDTSRALYVRGTFVTTTPPERAVQTARGRETLYSVGSPRAEIYSSGTARLTGGEAYVSFDRLFAEALSSDAELRVTVTPVGGWSALYVESKGADGFLVRSDSGDASIEFDWVACGRSR